MKKFIGAFALLFFLFWASQPFAAVQVIPSQSGAWVDFVGLSTDIKPTSSTAPSGSSVVPGSRFLEHDTPAWYIYTGVGWSALPSLGSGSGNVAGPSSAANNNFASYNGTTGKLLKDSLYSASSFVSASGNTTMSGSLSINNALGLALGYGSTTHQGNLYFYNQYNANFFRIQSGTTGANIGWTLPIVAPSVNGSLVTAGTNGVLTYTDPAAFAPGWVDPNYNGLWGWDDADGSGGAGSFWHLGAGLAYDHATHTLGVSITSMDIALAQNYVFVGNSSGLAGASATIPASVIAGLVKVDLASFSWDNGATAIPITAGKRCKRVKTAATITGYSLLMNAASTSVFKLYKAAFSDTTLPTTDITGAHYIGTTAKLGKTDDTLTDWTVAVTAGDVICAECTTNDVATWATLTLHGVR